MSTPAFDNDELNMILVTMEKMKSVEHRIIEGGMEFSHISGILYGVDEYADLSMSFTEIVERLIKKNEFTGRENTGGHYLTKAWEISKVLYWIDRTTGNKLLNIGGGSTIINFYLASIGYDITSIDCCWAESDLVENEKMVADKLELPIESVNADFIEYDANAVFNAVFSICVIEHIETRERQRLFIENMARHTAPGGLMLLTFGYGNKATCNPFRNEKEIDSLLYAYLDGFDIVEPFYFNGFWSISNEHTWGFVAAKKR
ncbi:MAG: class I SAM-dependent methyltransferase [Desulfobacteraceae bacterium]|nr:class I SAM-dependent methyltransferase [Desulfobacteraceae bacterium]